MAKEAEERRNDEASGSDESMVAGVCRLCLLIDLFGCLVETLEASCSKKHALNSAHPAHGPLVPHPSRRTHPEPQSKGVATSQDSAQKRPKALNCTSDHHTRTTERKLEWSLESQPSGISRGPLRSLRS